MQSFSGVPGALRPSLKMVCEPQILSLESVFKASSRYSEHIRNNQKPRKFRSETVGSSEVLACTGPISRNPLVTRSVRILLSGRNLGVFLSWKTLSYSKKRKFDVILT